MKKICLLTFIIAFAALAQMRLPNVISDNMVLQRNSSVKLWGWAAADEEVKITTGWNNTEYRATAGRDGKWAAEVKTAAAGGPYSIRIQGRETTLEVKNVMLGEVWFCSGQSNMEFRIRQTKGWEGYEEDKKEIAANDFSAVRVCVTERQTSNVPEENIPAAWKPATEQNYGEFSAVAYYFGIELYKKLKIPVGLIASSWGGTRADYWIQREVLQRDERLAAYINTKHQKQDLAASSLFNGMVNPFLPYRVAGVLWYQGEANRAEADLYQKTMTELITSWRASWNCGAFPFYYVQIAPYNYGIRDVETGYLREAQVKTLSVPNTGMAITMDIGNVNDIHPKNKRDVGKRLALWALAKTYKQKSAEYSGPLYKSMKISGKTIQLSFEHVSSGIVPQGKELTGFTIAGADRVFHEAKAVAKGKKIIVQSDKVSKPLYARYAFGNTDTASFFNGAMLPASSFRTDTLPFFFRKVYTSIQWDKETGEPKLSVSKKETGAEIRYTLDGTEPGIASAVWENPVPLKGDVTIKARMSKNGILSSYVAENSFYNHSAVRANVQLAKPNASKFKAAPQTLVDGIYGNPDYRSGTWCAFEAEDMEAILDLGKTGIARKVSVDFLEDQRSWVFFPKSVTVQTSRDGVTYSAPETITIEDPVPAMYPATKKLTIENKEGLARFIKVTAVNRNVCPEWHVGAGAKSWIFCDEIIVE